MVREENGLRTAIGQERVDGAGGLDGDLLQREDPTALPESKKASTDDEAYHHGSTHGPGAVRAHEERTAVEEDGGSESHRRCSEREAVLL